MSFVKIRTVSGGEKAEGEVRGEGWGLGASDERREGEGRNLV